MYRRGSSRPLLGSIITIIIVTVVVTITLTSSASVQFAISSPTGSGAALAWHQTSTYPLSVWASSCVTAADHVYCVGGDTGAAGTTPVNSAFYAPLSGSGVGRWSSTTGYPVPVTGESCITTGSTIYCVGGSNGENVTSAVYYATLTSAGIGSWTAAPSYPVGLWHQACAASSEGVYCVGGGVDLSNSSGVVSVYYAPFSGSGLGNWTSAPAYPFPVRQQSCLTTSTDLYCFGGRDETSVYYAPLTPSGLGQWTETTGYPLTVGANLMSCVLAGSLAYCIAGHTGVSVSKQVFSAPLSTTGVGQWSPSTDYAEPVWGESCVYTGGAIYCVGGYTASSTAIDQVWYTPV
jgi:hypothetical protein